MKPVALVSRHAKMLQGGLALACAGPSLPGQTETAVQTEARGLDAFFEEVFRWASDRVPMRQGSSA